MLAIYYKIHVGHTRIIFILST